MIDILEIVFDKLYTTGGLLLSGLILIWIAKVIK
jgi:hypothetical protein